MSQTTLQRVGALGVTEAPGVRRLKDGARVVRERYCTATWQSRVLPELIVAGAQRCGTTAITEALFRMPMVARPRRGKGSHFFSYNYWRGEDWFQGNFATRSRAERIRRATGHRLMSFDACPYYLFHPFALERMARHLPDVKVMVMLRDPVKRAYSHYHHSVAHGFEDLGFEAALEAESDRLAGEVEAMAADVRYWSLDHEHHSYVAKGQYAAQIERLFSLYPREQCLVFSAEQFYADSDGVLGRVTDWLDLPPATLAASDERNGHRYEPMTDATRAHLAAAFEESNEALFELLGERFAWTRP